MAAGTAEGSRQRPTRARCGGASLWGAGDGGGASGAAQGDGGVAFGAVQAVWGVSSGATQAVQGGGGGCGAGGAAQGVWGEDPLLYGTETGRAPCRHPGQSLGGLGQARRGTAGGDPGHRQAHGLAGAEHRRTAHVLPLLPLLDALLHNSITVNT